MAQTVRRPLTLHVSALSDAEYSSFTRSLGELTSPNPPQGNWEDLALGVREARGWIRGRYGVGVDGATIDQILKNFSPELGPQDMLTGGQFFAVLRLVCHAHSGTPVDNSLVFVQANPEPAPPKEFASSSTKSAPPPPPRRSSIDIPASAITPSLPPRAAPPIPGPNPFTRSLSTSAPSRPRADSQPQSNPESVKRVSDSPASSNPFRTQPSQHSWPKPRPADPSVSSSSSSSSAPLHTRQYSNAHTTPPLPPRKSPAAATLLPPPRHGSLTPTSVHNFRGSPAASGASPKSYSLASSALLPPPPKPPKPPQATSPLIKQSLQAAKGAQSVKELMDGLSKERRLEVIKKSGGGGGSGGQGGRSSGGSRSEEGTPHYSVSPPHSLYDVASARIGRAPSPSSYSSSSGKASVKDAHRPLTMDQNIPPQFPFSHVVTSNTPATRSSPSPSPSISSLPTLSPDHSPTHDGFSAGSGATITRRSKSLHHASPVSIPSVPASYSPSHNAPLPPPRRRRPESVQVTTSSPTANATDGRPGHIRRSSASVFPTLVHGSSSTQQQQQQQHKPTSTTSTTMTTSDSSVLDTLHRTIATLRPGSGFESARVKAEGRVWPSGYVKGLAKGRGGRDGEGGRLVRDSGGVDGDDEGDGGFGQDQDWERGMDDDEGVGDGGGRARLGAMERDDLKMPVKPGEGWKALT